MSLDEARAHVKRNEHANHKCRRAIEARNAQLYNNILQKRDAYGFVFNNDTEYTPQGFNTSLCSLSEETTVGPYVCPPLEGNIDSSLSLVIPKGRILLKDNLDFHYISMFSL